MNQTAILAGGCFWGMEARFQNLKGVLETEVGYTGGNFADPTYRQVCQEITGHVEAVKIEFDPAVISYRAILEAFFKFHDPTLSKDNCSSQSSQYGSVIFPLDEDQTQIAEAVLQEIKTSNFYDCRVDTIIQPASVFYPAEEYHQDYYKKHNLIELEDFCC